MASENVFLFYALLMGIFITFLYDILRIFRRAVPHAAFWVSAEDLCFWIYCAARVFLLMYHESDGTLRWFAVLGALAGMFAYRKFVSPVFVKYASLLLRKLIYLLVKIVSFLFAPAKRLQTRLKKAVRAASVRAGRRKERRRRFFKKKLTHLLKVLKM